MINKSDDTIKRSATTKEESKNSKSGDSQPIFLKKPLLDSSENAQELPEKFKNRKICRNFILDKIRQLAPLDISKLQKELGISYGTLWEIIRQFEFCGLIYTTERIDTDTNNKLKIIHVLKLKEEIKENE